MCSGVVDYPFVVFNTQSLATLETTARFYAVMGNPFLKTSCLIDIKRFICASVYLQCVPGVVPTNPATFDQIANIQPDYPEVQLPYRRPCASLCTAVSYAGTTCQGTLEGFGVPLPCLDTYPSTGGYFSLYSSDGAKCNSLASSAGLPLVADKTEPYVGKACHGVTTSLYIPTSSMVDPTGQLAPLLPPFVLQSLLEAQLVTIFSATPRWLKQDCNTAQRTLLCPVTLLKAQPLSTLQAVFGITIYLPSFPARALCENYRAKCPFLVNNVPQLNINCSMVVQGVSAFPKADQVVASIPALAAFGPLITSPNTLPDLDPTFVVPTQCPWGLAVPALPPMRGELYLLPDTGCATECPFKVYSDDEFARINDFGLGIQILNFALYFLVGVQIAVVPIKKQNIFINISVISWLIFGFADIVHSLQGRTHFLGRASSQCSSATSWYAEGDQYEPSLSMSSAASSCLFVAYGIRINVFINAWFVTSLWGDIWFKVMYTMRDVTRVRIYYSWIPLLGYIGIMLLPVVYNRKEGKNTWNDKMSIIPICQSSTGSERIDVMLPQIVNGIVSIIACILISVVIYTSAKTTMKARSANEKNPLLKIWKTYRTVIIYAGVCLLMVPGATGFSYIYLNFLRTKPVTDSTTNWFNCLFSHFTNSDSDPSGGSAFCGATPSDRIAIMDIYIYLGIYTVLAISLLWASSNNETNKMWWSLVPRVLQNSIFCALCSDGIKVMPSTSAFFKDSAWMDKSVGAQTSVVGSEARGESGIQRSTAGSSADDDSDSEGEDDDLSDPASIKVSKKAGRSGLGPAAADAARRAQEEAAALEAELCEDGHAPQSTAVKAPMATPQDGEAREVDGESKDTH